MSIKSTGIVEPRALQYVLDKSLREQPVQRELRENTLAQFVKERNMMGAPEESQLLAMFIRMMQCKRIVEVGVFTGYTTLTMALAATNNGTSKDGVKIVALDTSEKFTRFGETYWQRADVSDVIDLRLGPAVPELDSMAQTEEGTYDLCFIDCDKENYPTYYEQALKLVRVGGLIAIDNTLWHGNVYDERVSDELSPSTRAIRQLNNALKDDERVELAMTTVGDGLTLCLKK